MQRQCLLYNKELNCLHSLMDRVAVFGTADRGSIPLGGTGLGSVAQW